MPVNLPLKDMSLHEKLSAMESLWEDLTRTPEVIESPAWHKEILDERSQRIADGSAHSSIGKPQKPTSATSSREHPNSQRGTFFTATLPFCNHMSYTLSQ